MMAYMSTKLFLPQASKILIYLLIYLNEFYHTKLHQISSTKHLFSSMRLRLLSKSFSLNFNPNDTPLSCAKKKKKAVFQAGLLK